MLEGECSMKKVFLTLLILAFSLCVTGCEFSDVMKYVHDAFKPDYLMDADLESATWKNSSEPGAITGRRALDATKDKYASTFNTKLYFDEIGEYEDKSYVYYNKNSQMYLALSGMVNLEGEDYYEIIMFKYDNPGSIYDYSKNILESYYVNIKTLEIYASSNKPVETYEIKDDTYGFVIHLPKEYEENYITLYEDEFTTQVSDKDIEVRVITVSYREGNVSNDLFDIICFKGQFETDDFNTGSDAFFLGSNDTYSICLMARNVENNYLEGPRKILNEDLEMIVSSTKLFDVSSEDKQ